MASVREWLHSIGFGRHAAAFDRHAIDWDVVPRLDYGLLKEIGIPVGDRLRILDAIKSHGARRPRGGERRQLTILFCDLEGFTELSSRLDAEHLRNVLDAYRDVCQIAIKSYKGFLAQYYGDGVLAYFGYPLAHEHEAERAVRAGLRIVESLDILRLPPPKGDGPLKSAAAQQNGGRMKARIGIATGSVVVGDLTNKAALQENAAIGEAVNVAARLQALAEANSVVIAPDTRRLAMNHFEYQDLGEHRLKGLSEPVRLWKVAGERRIASRSEAQLAFGTTPFVGRAEDLASILRHWECVENGKGQVVLLSGEPGIGKSRFAEVLRERIRNRPHARIRYQCSPFHTNSALHPVIEHMRRSAKLDGTGETSAMLDRLEAWVRRAFDDADDARAVVPLYAALLSIDAADRYPVLQREPAALKTATLKALARQVYARAKKQPLLLIIEDAQWMDPTLRQALDLIVSGIEKQRILALITCRTDEYFPPWRGLAQEMVLKRLPHEESELMIAQLSGEKPLSHDLVERVAAKAEGVPLFIEELTKAVLESGPSHLAIPATLREILMARLDRAAPMREVAQIGACIGRQFSRELLAAVTELDAAALSAALERLENAGLVFRGGTREHATYTFKHALVRDEAYDSLLTDTRKGYHARIAEALVKSADIRACAPETLAHHCMESDDFERAALYWHRAAKRAGARYANAEAIEHCRKGLAALCKSPRRYERTLLELTLRIRVAEGLRNTDHYDEALAELETAEAVATQSRRLGELSRVHHLRGNLYYPQGKAPECSKGHEAALRFAEEARSTAHEARALGGLGDAHFLSRRILTAHEHFEKCVALSRANRQLRTEVAYLPMRAVTHMYCLRYPEALDDCRLVIDLAAQEGRARGELISRSTSSWILLDQDQPDLAEEDARKGLETVETIGARRFIPLFNDVLARLRMRAGNRRAALELLEASWKVSRETRVAFVGPVVLGAIALATDDAGRRTEALCQGEEILRVGTASHNYCRFYRDAIEVSLRERQWDAADAYASKLERYFNAEPAPWSDFFVARGRALAAAGRRARNSPVVARLRQLRELAASSGLKAAVPYLDQALQAA